MMDKNALVGMLAKSLNNVVEYIPENERPDMSTVAQFFVETFGKALHENGRSGPPGFSTKLAEWVHDNWKPWKDDVIIVSHAKTGTTWTREIVSRILYKDDERIRGMVAQMMMPHLYLETGLPKKFEMLDRLPWKRRIFSTHMPEDLVNTETINNAGAKMIYTVRNPKDTMVSLFKMLQGVYPDTEEKKKEGLDDWNAFVEHVVSGKASLMMKEGEWFPNHVLGWYKHKNDENVLFVVYEDMKKDPKKEIQRIAKFLEVDLNGEELNKIVVATNFKTMKQQATDILKNINFFAKGEVGYWKNHFTVAQSELVDKKLEEILSSCDITFTYEL